MTCKDCIHYNICCLWSTSDLDKDESYKYCFGNFKDKSRYIELPCKVGDKVAVRALCECVLTTPNYEECRNMCPFEDDCECDECDSSNERIFDTTVSSIFNNGQGWYMEFNHLIPFARFTDIGKSFFVGENAHEQAIAYEKALAERSRQ